MKNGLSPCPRAAGSRGLPFTLLAVAALGLAQCQAALTTGLEGYWQFNGNGNDSSGNGRDLTVQGSAPYGPGVLGQALSVQGDTSTFAYRSVNDPAFNFGAGDFTVQLWADFTSQVGIEVLVEKFYGQSGPGWTLYTQGGGSGLTFYTSGAGVFSSSPLSISLNVWNQVVLVRSGSSLKMYFDDQTVMDTSISGAINPTTEGLFVGRRNLADGRPFSTGGSIDEVAIWNRGLSSSEVAALWNQGNALDLTAIPEPTSLFTGAVALGLVGFLAWRKRK